MLGFLTTGVLGAVHQFAPVVVQRPLRSASMAHLTAALFVTGAWTIAGGFAHGAPALVPIGGLAAFAALLIAAWNLSAPLSARGRGVPLVGLRLAVAYVMATAAFGVVYAFDRQAGWFPLTSNRVLAHARLGLVGWLGLTYLAVAEKLWPMFLLTHRPSLRAGSWAVGLMAGDGPLLTLGLLLGTPGWRHLEGLPSSGD